MNNLIKSFTLAFSVFLCLTVVSGCAGTFTTEESSEPSQKLVDFAGVPVPNNFDLDRSKSFVYESGSGEVKVGRLYFSGWNDLKEVLAYYQSAMVNRGWSLVNSIEQENIILNYEKEGWACTLNLSPGWFKTYVEIQIGPK